MLVDFEYLFLHGSFGLENFHTYNQHIDGLMPKKFIEKKRKIQSLEGCQSWQ